MQKIAKIELNPLIMLTYMYIVHTEPQTLLQNIEVNLIKTNTIKYTISVQSFHYIFHCQLPDLLK